MNYKCLVFSMLMFLLLVSCGDKKITNPDPDAPQITSISPSSGDIGDLVTIYGKNFGATQGTSYISFNSIIVVDYLEWSDTEIKIKIPTGATTGKISISINGSETITIYFTIEITNPGNFETVIIGNQVWMKKNLDVNHYRNGDPIPQVTDSTEWKNLKTGAWCYLNNDPANGAIYGKLYNWYAVNDLRGLSPEGWHVSSDDEWTTLLTYLGGESIAGGKLKSTGTIEDGDGLWGSPNEGATDEFGFSALPGGERDTKGKFWDGMGHWWCFSSRDLYYAWCRDLFPNNSILYRDYDFMVVGYSVRCVKD